MTGHRDDDWAAPVPLSPAGRPTAWSEAARRGATPPDAAAPPAAAGTPAEPWSHSATPDAAWSEADAAAHDLRRELDSCGLAGELIGFRVVRDASGRPVVQLGSVEPPVARDLAAVLRTATAIAAAVARADGRRTT